MGPSAPKRNPGAVSRRLSDYPPGVITSDGRFKRRVKESEVRWPFHRSDSGNSMTSMDDDYDIRSATSDEERRLDAKGPWKRGQNKYYVQIKREYPPPKRKYDHFQKKYVYEY